MGRRTVVEDALGRRTTTVYDAAGLPLSTTVPGGSRSETGYDVFRRGWAEKGSQIGGDLNLSNLATFDEVGRTVLSRDAAGYSSATKYDITGRALGSSDALGASSASAFDILGRSPKSFDPLGRGGSQSYDNADRVTSSSDALGNVSTMTYDAAGNVLTQSDHAGRITAYEYDALHRVKKTIYAQGTAQESSTETVYDAVGNTLATKDERGFWTTFSYDALNRRVGTLDAVGNRTTTVFDTAGKPHRRGPSRDRCKPKETLHPVLQRLRANRSDSRVS